VFVCASSGSVPSGSSVQSPCPQEDSRGSQAFPVSVSNVWVRLDVARAMHTYMHRVGSGGSLLGKRDGEGGIAGPALSWPHPPAAPPRRVAFPLALAQRRVLWGGGRGGFPAAEVISPLVLCRQLSVAQPGCCLLKTAFWRVKEKSTAGGGRGGWEGAGGRLSSRHGLVRSGVPGSGGSGGSRRLVLAGSEGGGQPPASLGRFVLPRGTLVL